MLRVTKDQHTGRRRRMTPERWRSAAVMTFGGPKGTITLSLMLTIPFFTAAGDLFPMRDELIFIASGVIIVTLLLANFLLPLIAPNRGTDDSHEITEITIDVLRRTVEELTQRITPENRRAVLMVIDSYTKRITRLKQRIGGVDPHGFEQLQIDALYWRRTSSRNGWPRCGRSPPPTTTIVIWASRPASACSIRSWTPCVMRPTTIPRGTRSPRSADAVRALQRARRRSPPRHQQDPAHHAVAQRG